MHLQYKFVIAGCPHDPAGVFQTFSLISIALILVVQCYYYAMLGDLEAVGKTNA